MEELNNPPAFPQMGYYENGETYCIPGATLLDYFAAKAMKGIILRWGGNSTYDEGGNTYSHCAKEAYNIAEAMLKERQKRGL